MPLKRAVITVIKMGGEEGRFGEKGTSEYFKEYYGGEDWRGELSHVDDTTT